MKNLIGILIVFLIIIGCSTSKPNVATAEKPKTGGNDTIKIVNEELEYEVIIIEPGFDFWLASTAYPRGYLSQSYMETKNYQYVLEWNNRVRQPQIYSPNLYEMTIDYSPHINYGYEVNYLIYNYMIFFQNKYNQSLYGRVPPR
ncbi:DUF6146 family protein [Flavobacterium gilvum]|uniref:Lipoprotein n=1 Tax=Flavobacterium gilvum TaxID=1492737 RepID=A0AAC9I3Q1_9FLAO|nr:DUF6146 family protein [Flavobacterium gilvum]AOW09754.1 hypothetical protein EM308_09690 [Flavobacterium gilvum]KFC60389.1 hypothetical protein FEM08_08660 [Flavobacterium gilvum]